VGEAGAPSAERCDGLDNDCDGLTDEALPSEGLACEVGVGACARLGAWRCEAGALSCDAQEGAPSVERCDELDNDCDGRTDEGFFQVGTPCVSGVGACMVRGVWRCDELGGLSCGQGALTPELERCDGLDNDCDGLADEHAREERCDGLDNDCDGATDETLGPEVCDLEDNDCDGAIDESPCAPCEATGGCPTLSWHTLPAGEFTMGDGQGDRAPARAVSLPSFQLTQEVTVAQYLACVAAGACTEALSGGDCNLGHPDRLSHPINCVTWGQAWSFARWVGARLPSEAQWEYAARAAGRSASTPWLDATSVSCARAHLSDSGGFGCGQGASVPVCSAHLSLGQSPEGLCDLLGNVSEWVWDDYVSGYEGAPSDERPRCGAFGCIEEGHKVTRGGGWRDDIEGVDALTRAATLHSLRAADLGFRVTRSGP
jgi:formylglycine-generating enzyme required for sulfatase activity